jgi:hypothetical protein
MSYNLYIVEIEYKDDTYDTLGISLPHEADLSVLLHEAMKGRGDSDLIGIHIKDVVTLDRSVEKFWQMLELTQPVNPADQVTIIAWYRHILSCVTNRLIDQPGGDELFTFVYKYMERTQGKVTQS